MDSKTTHAYHSEGDFILLLLRAGYENHRLSGVKEIAFREAKEYIECHFDLNDADWEKHPSNQVPRWKQILVNLKSNRTLEKMGLALPIDGGFELTQKGLDYVEGKKMDLGGHKEWLSHSGVTKTSKPLMATRYTLMEIYGDDVLLDIRNRKLKAEVEYALKIKRGEDLKQSIQKEIVRDIQGHLTFEDFSNKYGLVAPKQKKGLKIK